MKFGKRSIELSVICLILLVFALIVSKNPSITGFMTTNTFTQKLNLDISESKLIGIESLSSEPIKLTSLMISGKVTGEGLVEIYLVDGSQRLLVYSNLQKKKNSVPQITGMATGTVKVYEKEKLNGHIVTPEDYNTLKGAFTQECFETCFLNEQESLFHDLEVWVQPGTKVKITELKYSIIE